MITKTIELEVSSSQTKNLLQFNNNIEKHLEKGKPLQLDLLEGLFNELTEVVSKNPAIQNSLDEHKGTSEHLLLNLQHTDH